MGKLRRVKIKDAIENSLNSEFEERFDELIELTEDFKQTLINSKESFINKEKKGDSIYLGSPEDKFQINLLRSATDEINKTIAFKNNDFKIYFNVKNYIIC